MVPRSCLGVARSIVLPQGWDGPWWMGDSQCPRLAGTGSLSHFYGNSVDKLTLMVLPFIARKEVYACGAQRSKEACKKSSKKWKTSKFDMRSTRSSSRGISRVTGQSGLMGWPSSRQALAKAFSAVHSWINQLCTGSSSKYATWVCRCSR